MTPVRSDPWRDVSAARLPASGVVALASVRDRGDVRVSIDGPTAWVRWPAGRADVVRCLLPVPGVAFFTHSDGAWVRFGRLVPTDERPPDGGGLPPAAVLSPSRFQPLAPEPPTWAPVLLSVVHGGTPAPVAALSCRVGELVPWADAATTAELAAVRAARAGDRAFLLGGRLPALPNAIRFWGAEVLVPLGFKADPDLPDAVLREALGVGAEELLVLDGTGAELIPLAAFEPLTRAGVWLGVRSP